MNALSEIECVENQNEGRRDVIFIYLLFRKFE